MDTIFGRKKGRPRQPSVTSTQDLSERSVPYDKLAPPPPSPLPRGISAPNTNPSLTLSGTEFNKFALQRSRAERERIYEQNGFERRPASPDAATLYDDHTHSPSKFPPQTPQSSRTRLSQASTSSGTRSPLFEYPTTTTTATPRPNSTATTRSEASRSSKYAPSLSSSEAGTHHSLFYHNRSNQNPDTFYFPRPSTDDEIEALFENVKRTRDLTGILDLSIDQKWHMVYSDEHIRWSEDHSRRHNENAHPTAPSSDTPDWYIKKFLDKTITPKQAQSLSVSLRSNELSWFQRFITLKGTSVLAQTLMHISRKGPSRSVIISSSFLSIFTLPDAKTILPWNMKW